MRVKTRSMISGHSGIGESSSRWVCCCNAYTNVMYIGIAGDTLGRQFEDAVYYARQQRQAHNEFTLTFRGDQITQWTQMVQDWYENPTNPDPFQEPEQSSLFVVNGKVRITDQGNCQRSRLLKFDTSSLKTKKGSLHLV